MKRMLVVAITCGAVALWGQEKSSPRIFVQDSTSWEMKADVGGTDSAMVGTAKGGARPQTAEIIKTLGQRCPNVIVNNRKEKADYVVLLDHEGGKDLISRDNKVVVFNRDGDSILSHSTRSLGNSVRDACTAIMKDWMSYPSVNASVNQSPATEATKVDIASNPVGADIEINGDFVGSTPSSINLASGDYEVVIKKNGFASWERRVKVTGGNVNLVAELQKQ